MTQTNASATSSIPLPGSHPIVWLQAPNPQSLNRSLATLLTSLSSLPSNPSTIPHQGNHEGWTLSPSGSLRYIIQCPHDEDIAKSTEPPLTPQQQLRLNREERYQRRVEKRAEAEQREEARKRKRSVSPPPREVQRSNMDVASALKTDDLTMDIDGYPVQRGQLQQRQGQPAATIAATLGIPSSSSSEQRAVKSVRMGDWLERLGSPGSGPGIHVAGSQVLENQMVEDHQMMMGCGDGRDVVSETAVAGRVIRPVRRSMRHASHETI